MRVTTNSLPDTLLRRLQSLGADQNKAILQLSTGQRISAPSDDAPAMQRILNLRSEKKQSQQFYRNTIDGVEISKASFASLDQMKNIMSRASELAASIGGATSDQEYKAKFTEINQLIEQGLNVANSKLRGSYLFAGDASGSTQAPFLAARNPQSGLINKVEYKGSDHIAEMNITETARISAFVSPSENADIAAFLNKLLELRDSVGAEASPDKANKILGIRSSSFSALGQTDASEDSLSPYITVPAGSNYPVGSPVVFQLNPGEGAPLESGITYYVKESFPDANPPTISVAPSMNQETISITSSITGLSTIGKPQLDEFEDKLLSMISRAGSVQYRLETVSKDHAERYDATEQLISKDADVDFAEATMRLNRAQMAYQAAIQSGARIQSYSLLDYIR
jgi:flagellin-like hook-associated protein FlgL